MIEVTGAPGSGKTTLFSQSRSLPIFIFPLIMPVFLIFIFFLKPKIIFYLFKNSFYLNRPLFQRFAFFYFCINKIFKFYLYKNRRNEVIDEGISHIPFNLEMESESSFFQFVSVFESLLKHIDVKIIVVSSEVLEKRIIIRGHSRISENSQVPNFVFRNKQVEMLMVKLLSQHVNSFEVLINESP
jgi:hypothetical protein